MPVVHAPETAYAQEMRKWEATHTQYGAPGRPYTFQPFPTRMYRASRPKAGGPPIFDGQTANDEHEQRNLESRGFVVGGQAAALDALEKTEFAHAELHANRLYQEQRMSDKARAEADAVDQATSNHLPVIPEQPIKRRGRKPKVSLTA